MRTLTTRLLLFFIPLVFYSCSGSQTNSEWSSLSYMYESGPLPPKYQYNYSITLNTKLEGGMVAFVGADPSNPSLTYDFKITKENVKSLDEAVKKSKILEDVIESIPEGSQPIGGHLEKIRVILYEDNPNLDRPPRAKESPYFPVDKYKAGLQKLYEMVKSFVPKKVWDDFETKKQEYQSK